MARCDSYHYAIKEEDEELIAALYLAGLPGREIADKFETHHKAIYRTLERLGIKRRTRWHDVSAD
jgi:DNA invertase Pin-like site-specific DNA recombinase